MALGLVYINSSAMWHCQYFIFILSFSLYIPLELSFLSLLSFIMMT